MSQEIWVIESKKASGDDDWEANSDFGFLGRQDDAEECANYSSSRSGKWQYRAWKYVRAEGGDK